MEFPRPLPELVCKTVQLETGFYPNEVVALENGWRLIKQRLVNHSTKISVNFFSEHFWLLERFRDAETKKINLRNLHQHTHQIMNIYGRLIGTGLTDAASINMVLSDVKSMHKLYGVNIDDIKLIMHCIKQYLLDFLNKVKSATFESGLDKLSELIIGHHQQEETAGDNLPNEQT